MCLGEHYLQADRVDKFNDRLAARDVGNPSGGGDDRLQSQSVRAQQHSDASARSERECVSHFGGSEAHNGRRPQGEHAVHSVRRLESALLQFRERPGDPALTTRDGVPLENPIAEAGSYEWLETSPACRVRVFWENPRPETIRGQLDGTRVELFLDSSANSSLAHDVPSNRTHHTFSMSPTYCSSEAPPRELRVAFRTMSRVGPNETLAATTLRMQTPQAPSIKVTRSSIQARCQSAASDASCSALTAAVLLASAGMISSNQLRTANASRLLLCARDEQSNEPTMCSYLNSCETAERSVDAAQQTLTLHVSCNNLSQTLTVARLRTIKVAISTAWNSTARQELEDHSALVTSRVNARIYQRSRRAAAFEQLEPTPLQTSPLQWGTCSEVTLGTPNLCPRSPKVLIDSIVPESYNFFESYRVHIRWASNVVGCVASTNETNPKHFELYWQRTSDSNDVSAQTKCEDLRNANAIVNGTQQAGERVVARVELTGEASYEAELRGLDASLVSGGARYRVHLLANDAYGARVTRVTFVFAVVGWSGTLVCVVGVVAVALLVALLIWSPASSLGATESDA